MDLQLLNVCVVAEVALKLAYHPCYRSQMTEQYCSYATMQIYAWHKSQLDGGNTGPNYWMCQSKVQPDQRDCTVHTFTIISMLFQQLYKTNSNRKHHFPVVKKIPFLNNFNCCKGCSPHLALLYFYHNITKNIYCFNI